MPRNAAKAVTSDQINVPGGGDNPDFGGNTLWFGYLVDAENFGGEPIEVVHGMDDFLVTLRID